MTSLEKTSVLVVVSSMAIGGPQKSLIGLLDRLDYELLCVDLMVLNGRTGPLSAFVPSSVRVIDTPRRVVAATLPSAEMARSLGVLLRSLSLRTLPAAIWELLKGVSERRGWQRVRQRVWRVVSRELPRVPGTYDAAFGILGLSTYAIVDLVDARFKYHWVRSDTRVLERDEVVDREYYDKLAGAVAVSKQCAEIFQDMYPSIRGNMAVYKNDIPRGIGLEGSIDTAPLRGGSFTLLTISRLDHLKGLDLAIGACAALVERGFSPRWIVLGEGPERVKLEKMIRARDLCDFFTLPGSVLNTIPYLERADIYVHPSRTEGRSNAVEEARALGKPIVATAYETVADQVADGVTGVVCAIDSLAIADAIERLLAEPSVGRRLGEQARHAYDSETCDPDVLMRMACLGDVSSFGGGIK
ncbi:glycosyltransferase [Rhodococcus sp. X156]|uniref:glycosyltransferase n=1 Tax=Rhodococcus sp. X156 TaxID=2499145 RepID=UPI0013E33100|nr:glycosyltransferase [Rhodococcus sp. X156]